MKGLLEKFMQRFKPAPKSLDWEDYFHRHETLLWEGAPVPAMQVSVGMVFLSLFGIPFLAAGLFILSMGGAMIVAFESILGAGFGLFLMAFSLPFVMVGASLTIGIWILSYYTPQFTRYAVSSKRAYIAKSWWNHTMESYPIRRDSKLDLREGRSDTVYFYAHQERDGDGGTNATRVGFENIADGAAVYALLRKVQEEAKS